MTSPTFSPTFTPGRNIAMKVPAHEYDRTVTFYRDVLGFKELTDPADSSTDTTRFEFGNKVLWIDRVPGMSQAELWLEIETDDVEAAAAHLTQYGGARCDDIDPLPSSLNGFWLSSPCNIIHLIAQRDDER